jgi:hypothetical protein
MYVPVGPVESNRCDDIVFCVRSCRFSRKKKSLMMVVQTRGERLGVLVVISICAYHHSVTSVVFGLCY